MRRQYWAEVERHAAEMLRMAGAEPTDGATPQRLSLALLGTPPRMGDIPHEACLFAVEDRWQIVVRTGTNPTRARWLALHELAEWYYATTGYDGDDIESRSDALGAALAAPQAVFLRVLSYCGDDVAAMARCLRTTQSLALLRRGECLHEPVALVQERRVMVRGAAYDWPHLTLDSVRQLDVPGLRKVRIGDEPGRVGVRAA